MPVWPVGSKKMLILSTIIAESIVLGLGENFSVLAALHCTCLVELIYRRYIAIIPSLESTPNHCKFPTIVVQAWAVSASESVELDVL